MFTRLNWTQRRPAWRTLAGLLELCLSYLALATMLAAVAPRPASAQVIGGGIVFDPTNFARNILHYARRLEQMDLQKQQLEQQLAAMRKLPNPPWRNIANTVAQIDAVMADGRALAYQLRDLQQEFHATFPGDQTFHDWPAERGTQSQRTIATIGAALASTQAQAQSVPDGLSRLADIKSRVGSIEGHQAALELQNTATVFSAEELLLLRQALMAQTSMQAVYYADQVNRDAQQALTIDSHMTALSVPARRQQPVSLRVNP